METVYWTMKDGTEIDVDEMSLTHLRNTLKMIIKKREAEQEGLEPWSPEFWKDGE